MTLRRKEGRRERDGIFLPFHTRMDREGDDSHRDDAGNFSDFLSRVSLVLLFPPPGASISLGEKRPLPDLWQHLEMTVSIPNSLSSSRVSAAAIMCFVICPLCLRLHVCILLFQLSHALLQKCTRVGELSGRWSELPLSRRSEVAVEEREGRC